MNKKKKIKQIKRQNTHKKDKTYQTHWKNILAYKNANELLIQIP